METIILTVIATLFAVGVVSHVPKVKAPPRCDEVHTRNCAKY